MDSESIEDLNVNYKKLGSSVEILERQIHQSGAKAAQLAGSYAIFGSIMYIQVLLPTSAAALGGGKRWIPVSLTASVSIAFWLTFMTAVNDCLRIRRQQDCTLMEQERLYRKIYSIRTGRRQDSWDSAAPAQKSLIKAFAVARCKRYAYVAAVHSALLCFTLLVLYALSSIPR